MMGGMAGNQKSQVGAKSAPTRARARKRVGKLIRGKRGLDYGRALAALVRGATTIAVAQAAGSKAVGRRNLSEAGRRIIETLGTQGQTFQVFNRLGYDVERFCRQIVAATEMKRVTRIVCDKEIHTFRDEDGPIQAKARDQYITVVGLAKLPQETETARTPLSGLSDEELANLEVGRPAGTVATGAAGPGAGTPAAT
jgi:hypothetical protein